MDVRNQRPGQPISAKSLRDLAKQADRSFPRGAGQQTMAGGSGRIEQWDGWTPFFITYESSGENAYSGVEASLDYSATGVYPSTPYAAILAGGRVADAQLSPIRSLRPDTTFEVDELVMARPSRSRPGDWEAVKFAQSRRNRITLPSLVYCANDELQVVYICLEGDFDIVPCGGSSSSSSGS